MKKKRRGKAGRKNLEMLIDEHGTGLQMPLRPHSKMMNDNLKMESVKWLTR